MTRIREESQAAGRVYKAGIVRKLALRVILLGIGARDFPGPEFFRGAMVLEHRLPFFALWRLDAPHALLHPIEEELR